MDAKKHILFVDDNENVISGIQRQLRPYREQWSVYFATCGKQALEIMQHQPIDLIVSDMMMPEMRGDVLLKRVADIYPATVRMVLSGYADEETLSRGLEVAHQYLTKPCSAEVLREAITQVFKTQDYVNNPRIAAEVGEASHLPSLPKIYHDLNAAIADERVTNLQIAEIFAKDMVLSAKLLHLVNSPYFGLQRTVSNLTDAINLIGLKKLNSLVLSVHIKTAFPVSDPEMERYMEYLWQDASRVAELARLISLSEQQTGDKPDQAYVGGLLHNMGLLIFMSRGGDKFKMLREQTTRSNTPVAALETEIFGFTRSAAAAYVLSLWKIPALIVESILWQNAPSESEYQTVNELTAVHVAACLANPTERPGKDRLFEMQLDQSYLQRIGRLHRLADWQTLAEKVTAFFEKK
ncbi:response regulator [Methylomonas sp. EFPC3]|uniref:response regulator n=1 Tax=Methylomonas sp. EFPC3 TaxID=3021710 RepID=UPI0024169361|nr:response regulator [Methylomonas sp. EFPC3]WFP51768.1 response regulator [Methylomonas sp. EFPC3]